MTTAAICATREVSWSPSFFRGEQYDSDLGLYYLRARYYNPLTGRFLSRDPEEGNKFYPKALHKYLYASGDPVNAFDPTGKDSILETGAIDKSFVLETLPAIVKYSCAVIEIWAFDAGVANLLDGYITGKSGEGGWPEPPKWLDLACAIPGWMAAQAEFGELFGGGE